jgi:hypothetical protein
MLELSPAETQLIALLRHHDIKNFRLLIHVNHNRWTVNLEDQDIGTVGTGSGADFAAAWDDIVHPRLRARS